MGNYRILKAAYQAYSRGNGQAFLDAMHDDVVVEYCAPADIFPFAGPLRGKQAVIRGVGQIAAEYEWLKFNLNHLLVDGDLAVVLTSGRIRHRQTMAEVKVDMVDVVRMRDGRIADVKEYFDSLGVAKKAGLRPGAGVQLSDPTSSQSLITAADGLAKAPTAV
jgi:ketosteroid isomerase-like protein